jgi:hypothetical protein
MPSQTEEMTRKPWSREIEDLLGSFQVDPDSGLSGPEAGKRREKYGPNRIRKGKTRGRWEILLDQFKSVIMALLAAAAVLSFAFGELVEGIAILAAIVINAGLGFLTLCSGLLAAAVYLPGLSRALKVSNPGLRGWILILGSSLVPLLFGQLMGIILPRTDRPGA